jgi:hypothetical protein
MLSHDADGRGTGASPALSDRLVWGPGMDFALAAMQSVEPPK